MNKKKKRIGPTSRKYPWEKWFSKSEFVVTQGQHFDCSIRGMLSQIRNRATVEQVKVSTRVADKKILVKVNRDV